MLGQESVRAFSDYSLVQRIMPSKASLPLIWSMHDFMSGRP